ncbi:hypothetical protein [Arthrobacter sp. 9V]|uniref:hypothetical protein n=1 Tax=Arthrobacter sp. 9V TaxID=2653132 RepID=UPI003FA41733
MAVATRQIAPVVAAGCTMVLKYAELCPLPRTSLPFCWRQAAIRRAERHSDHSSRRESDRCATMAGPESSSPARWPYAAIWCPVRPPGGCLPQ